MTHHKVWDPFVRIFHWTLLALFAANALVTDPESKVHEYLGYAIAALLFLRMLWGLVGSRNARFSAFMPSPQGLIAQLSDIATGRRRIHLGHTPLGALMLFNLLLTLAAIALTGFPMTTTAFWGVGWVEETHEVLVGWAEASIVVHVIAVLWESRRTGVNLPRAMITGVKTVPDGVAIKP